MAQILARVPQSMKDDLKREAKLRGQTLAALMKHIFWEWLKENTKHTA